jgi:hypothetical protein
LWLLPVAQSILTRRQENDDFHADVLVVVDLEPPQLVRKVEHLLNALLDAVVSGGGQSERLFVGDADNAGRGRDGAVAAGEDEQLAPRVDQQRDLVVNLKFTSAHIIVNIVRGRIVGLTRMFLKSGRLLHHFTSLYSLLSAMTVSVCTMSSSVESAAPTASRWSDSLEVSGSGC